MRKAVVFLFFFVFSSYTFWMFLADTPPPHSEDDSKQQIGKAPNMGNNVKKPPTKPILPSNPNIKDKDLYITFRLILDVSYMNSSITIDGKPAEVVDDLGFVKTIRLKKSDQEHIIDIRQGATRCRGAYIIRNNDRIVLHCTH